MKPEKPKRFDIDAKLYKNDYGRYQTEIERDYREGGDYYDAYDMDAYIQELESEIEKLRAAITNPAQKWWC